MPPPVTVTPRYHARRQFATMTFFFLMTLIVIALHACIVRAYSPEVNHRALAGLWRLKQIRPRVVPVSCAFPLKEFTTYPKKSTNEARVYYVTAPRNEEEEAQEMLLMLKEDGSFEQYSTDSDATSVGSGRDRVVIPDKLKVLDADDAVLDRYFGKICGKWDFIDGKLILAADRPKHATKPEDTLLVGEVVAVSEKSLVDNPALKASKSKDGEGKADGRSGKTKLSARDNDTHLSVPSGQVNVGKFFYPRNHPSFFEQPMFQPISKGRFQLRQVLGSLNAKSPDEDQLIEKFRLKDFHDKVFSLTTHPLPQWKPKGEKRWSIRLNKYVVDPPRKTKEQEEEEKHRTLPIRVMEVKFFANNTFSTVAGLGDSTILRGKYNVIGRDRDQFWMQIFRFGFGRSVSGSVYSEGNGLSKDDEKAYWGSISYADEQDDDGSEQTKVVGETRDNDKEDGTRPLIVKGSVLYGFGLEPQPVARFILREIEDEQVFYEDDEDEDEDIELNVKFMDEDGDDGIDWSNAFQ